MVVLIRHAQTDWNKPPSGEPEILRGGIDVPLNDIGRAEARKAGKQLCDFNVKYVASSSFSRDAESGRLIAAECNAPFVLDERLAPYNIGSLAGKYRRDVYKLLDWFLKHPDVAAPGGEPFFSVYNRQKNAIVDALAESERDKQAGGPETAIVLMVQGTTLRALPAMLNNDDWSQLQDSTENFKTADMVFL